MAGGYIRLFRGTVVTISHDRYFLDRTVTRIIEILDGNAEFYSGNYSFYAIEKERRYQERMKQYEKEQAKIQQLEKAAEQMHLWAFMGNDALHKRAFSMEKRIERMRTVEAHRAKKMDAQFRSREFSGRRGTAAQGRRQGLRRADAVLAACTCGCEGGERIALIWAKRHGKNHAPEDDHGRASRTAAVIKLGPSTKAAYLPQIIHFEHSGASFFGHDALLKRDIHAAEGARTVWRRIHFRGEDVFKAVSVLSGGEQSRLRLCMLMDDEVNSSFWTSRPTISTSPRGSGSRRRWRPSTGRCCS